jgi:hypothetical protein
LRPDLLSVAVFYNLSGKVGELIFF